MNYKRKITLLLLFFYFKTYGNHFQGAALTYQYSGVAGKYLVHLTYYRDCSGIPGPNSVSLCCSSVSCNLYDTIILNLTSSQELIMGPCQYSSGNTTCNAGINFGIEQWNYDGILILPQACNDWILAMEDCCRNTEINFGLINPGIYAYTTIDNLNFPVNTSPQFIFPSITQHCINQISIHQTTAVEPDGDSLVYFLDNSFDAVSNCPLVAFQVNYVFPFSLSYPFPTSSPALLNSSTGDLNFTPDSIYLAGFGVLIKEYRNGILVSTTHREDAINIINGVLNGEKNLISDKQVIVNPNPSTGNFIIETNENKVKELIVFSAFGEKVLDEKIGFSDSSLINFNLFHFSKGIYYLKIITKKEEITRMIVLQ